MRILSRDRCLILPRVGHDVVIAAPNCCMQGIPTPARAPFSFCAMSLLPSAAACGSGALSNPPHCSDVITSGRASNVSSSAHRSASRLLLLYDIAPVLLLLLLRHLR